MTIEWTKDELVEFNEVTRQCSSADQMERISGRMAVIEMVKKHGREKCDAMFEHLKKNNWEVK